jgi:hypothetical protein
MIDFLLLSANKQAQSLSDFLEAQIVRHRTGNPCGRNGSECRECNG